MIENGTFPHEGDNGLGIYGNIIEAQHNKEASKTTQNVEVTIDGTITNFSKIDYPNFYLI